MPSLNEYLTAAEKLDYEPEGKTAFHLKFYEHVHSDRRINIKRAYLRFLAQDLIEELKEIEGNIPFATKKGFLEELKYVADEKIKNFDTAEIEEEIDNYLRSFEEEVDGAGLEILRMRYGIAKDVKSRAELSREYRMSEKEIEEAEKETLRRIKNSVNYAQLNKIFYTYLGKLREQDFDREPLYRIRCLRTISEKFKLKMKKSRITHLVEKVGKYTRMSGWELVYRHLLGEDMGEYLKNSRYLNDLKKMSAEAFSEKYGIGKSTVYANKGILRELGFEI